MENHTARGLPRDTHSTAECHDRPGARKHVPVSDWEPSSCRHGLARAAQFYAGSSLQSLSVGNYQLSEERRRSRQAHDNGLQGRFAETGESGPHPVYRLAGPYATAAGRPSARASSLSTGEGKHDYLAESQHYYDSENLDIDFVQPYLPTHLSQPVLTQEAQNPLMHQKGVSIIEDDFDAGTP